MLTAVVGLTYMLCIHYVYITCKFKNTEKVILCKNEENSVIHITGVLFIFFSLLKCLVQIIVTLTVNIG